MQQFIHDANVRHLSDLLYRTTEPEERVRIMNLLTEELSKSPPRLPRERSLTAHGGGLLRLSHTSDGENYAVR